MSGSLLMGKRFLCTRHCCLNITIKHQKVPIGPIDHIMAEFVIVMSLLATLGVTKTAGSISAPKRNAGYIMMPWQM
ncbi:hypothetical protein ACSBR2_025158 [Camellia fascicularis]